MRQEYNQELVKKCIEFLKSSHPLIICEGIVLASYLIEQSFKWHIKQQNPLLYFDQKNCVMQAKIVKGNLNSGELLVLKTITPMESLAIMIEFDSDLESYKDVIEELFRFRNFLVHSVDDFPRDPIIAVETATASISACTKYISECSGILEASINPLTAEDYLILEKMKHDQRKNNLIQIVEEHKETFESMSEEEIAQRSNETQEESSTSWIEESIECPACKQQTFNLWSYVDFDWNSDGILECAGSSWNCQVCELELSPHEFDLFLES